jgi:hypothetical protein
MKRGKHNQLPHLLLTLAVALLLIPVITGCGAKAEEKVSTIGKYRGYSTEGYAEYTTTSQYVTMRDGVRIAVDIHKPVAEPDKKFPAILVMTPYHRANVVNGKVEDPMNAPSSLYREVLSHGYVFVIADVRGCGASFGTRYTIFGPEEVDDGNDLINWIVQQPWSDGNVGMTGPSYLGIIQFLNASNKNPHLKCIMPIYATLDLYSFVQPGGIYNKGFVEIYATGQKLLDSNVEEPAYGIHPSKPVDEDKDGSLLAAATAEHKNNYDMISIAKQGAYRDDSMISEGHTITYALSSPSSYLQEIEESGVAIYNFGGWFDCYSRDTLSYQATLANKSKTLIGPYYHIQKFDEIATEALRFFDKYLKGIDNGFENGPAYYYYVMGRNEWRSSNTWPLAEQVLTPYYFGEGRSLSTTKPSGGNVFDSYTVDYTTRSGKNTRWMAMAGVTPHYPDRSAEDQKCLTYTTAPLETDLEVTGHPVLHLYVSSTASDGDFFIYLEDVYPDGFVNYITEGMLRASNRKLSPRPWKPELPYHSCDRGDAQPLVPGEVVELAIDLLPTSYVFEKGHRLRISIAGADAGNFGTPVISPAPAWKVYLDGTYTSYLELPIIPQR